MLDSALGCSIFSTLKKGDTWTTLELKINYVRAMTKDSGPVRAEGRVIHRGADGGDLGRRSEGLRRQALRPRFHDLHDFFGLRIIDR